MTTSSCFVPSKSTIAHAKLNAWDNAVHAWRDFLDFPNSHRHRSLQKAEDQAAMLGILSLDQTSKDFMMTQVAKGL